ncbi:hypothetical protein VVMO6_03266 [Vibrio vulnificus MO6-24/O]|nr:hypothetical protein VVMO6_03266 [Vibrio vulnificus MO6-24/O]
MLDLSVLFGLKTTPMVLLPFYKKMLLAQNNKSRSLVKLG